MTTASALAKDNPNSVDFNKSSATPIVFVRSFSISLSGTCSLRRAIALNPKNASAHYFLSRAYAGKGMKSEAAAELEIARQLDPAYEYADPKKLPKEIPKKFRLKDA